MSKPRRDVAGPKMPCGRRHQPSLACAHCKSVEHTRIAAAYRQAASDAREKAEMYRRLAEDAVDLVLLLERYAAEHEAQA